MRTGFAWLLLLSLGPMVALADSPAGTFSIVAYDSLTNEVGVAVQSRVFGVGPRVAWVRGGVGAIATQAQSNESFGPTGIYLMEAGLSATETLDWLIDHDNAGDYRQVGLVDARGGVASWTGRNCLNWAGDSAGVAFTCQGNILVSAEVVAGMVRAFAATEGEDLASRMIAALEAAQAAGGDSRGQQSAALLVGRPHPRYPEYATRYIDIRVDDHPTPISELRRLYGIYEAQGLLQARMRFAEWLVAEGDSAGARSERDRVGQTMVRVLARDDADAGTLNALAWFCATNGLYLEASLTAAQRAAALEPGDSNTLDTLAEVYFRAGRVEEAIATAQRALGLAPGDRYLTEQLGRFQAARR